jgi:hypothetical protein
MGSVRIGCRWWELSKQREGERGEAGWENHGGYCRLKTGGGE